MKWEFLGDTGNQISNSRLQEIRIGKRKKIEYLKLIMKQELERIFNFIIRQLNSNPRWRDLSDQSESRLH